MRPGVGLRGINLDKFDIVISGEVCTRDDWGRSIGYISSEDGGGGSEEACYPSHMVFWPT